MIPNDLVLDGPRVRLEALDFKHAPDLHAVLNDPEVWAGVRRPNPFTTLEASLDYIAEAKYGERTAPGGVPLAIVDKHSGRAIGTTRYFEIEPANRKLEIGWTFLGRPYWRTHVNSETKFLMLRYAFEHADAMRVQFKATTSNQRSCTAILRLGAVFEGRMRNFRFLEGEPTDTSLFSIIASEWPAAKARLERFLP